MSEVKLENTYKTAFELNKSKLIRLNDVLDKHFQKITIGTLSVKHLAKFNNGKEGNFTQINELFNLDNGIKNRITEIKTTYKKDTSSAIINFDGDRRIPQISIYVEGKETDWVNECYAEVEEQTERTKLSGWIYELKKSNATYFLQVFAAALIMPIILIGEFSSLFKSPESNTISEKEKIRLELIEKAEVAKTTDEKINFLLEATRVYTLKDLPIEKVEEKKVKEPSKILQVLTNWKIYCIIIPILLLVGILFYIFSYCYWMYAFIWGDMEDDYKKMTDKRKTLWNILIGSLILGILSNLFVFGITETI